MTQPFSRSNDWLRRGPSLESGSEYFPAGLRLPGVPSPLVHDGIVYLIKNGGVATAVAAKTGEVLGQKRLTDAVERYFSSPVLADGKIYLAREGGKVVVLNAGPELDVLAINDLGENCYATPALADGRLYLRTSQGLYCFGRSSASAHCNEHQRETNHSRNSFYLENA